jgi:Zn-dependent protease
MLNVMLIVVTLAAFVVALTLHEAGHAAMAVSLGDGMATNDGRLSLRPARHMAPVGTLVAIVLSFSSYAGIGWGKPVRFDSMRLRVGPNTGTILIAMAGPLVNLLVGFAVAAGLHFIPGFDALKLATDPAVGSCPVTVFSVIAAGLHGYGLQACLATVQAGWLLYVEQFLIVFSVANIALALVNVLPLHPLDGYRVVFALLPSAQAIRYRQWEPQMEALLLVLFFVVPILLGLLRISFAPGAIIWGVAQGLATTVTGPVMLFALAL